MSVMRAGARWGKFGLKQERLAIKSPMWWTKRNYDLQPSYTTKATKERMVKVIGIGTMKNLQKNG